MRRIQKAVSIALSVWILLGCVVFPASAVTVDKEDPLAVKNFEKFGAALPEKMHAADGESAEADILPQAAQSIVQDAEEETAQDQTEPSEQTEPTDETIPEETTLPSEEATSVEETFPEAEETLPLEQTEPTEETESVEPELDENGEWIPRGHNGVPLYFQTDYPNNMYGMGTIASNGCSVTSLAMVATYMTGHEYLPDELARYFGGAAENNIARLEQGSKTLQLPFYKAENWHRTRDAIHDGKIAIVLVNKASIFTQSQHFIIITGMTEDGKYLVNDSYEPNYDKWDLKQGFREGFPESAIIQGYSGAWVYDKDALPEEPFIYSKPLPVRGEPRYDIELTQEEKKLLAKVVWVEARGECMEGQQAVAEVVLNRMASEDFPNTLRDVIYGEGQFRSVPYLDKAAPYQMQYEAIDNALYGPYVLPMDVYYFATTMTNDNVWDQIGRHIFCYSENWVPETTEPAETTNP